MILERFRPARLWRGLRSRVNRVARPMLKSIYRRLARRLIRDLMLEPEFRAIDKARLGMEGAACDQVALGRRLGSIEDRIEALLHKAPRQ